MKDIFDSILNKDYTQLTSKELIEINEYCKNEQEFLAMKEVLNHTKTISKGPKIAPKEQTKNTLDDLFQSTYGQKKRKPFYFNPLIQIAALFAIGFAVWILFFNNNSSLPKVVQMAENTTPEAIKNDVEQMKEEAPDSETEKVSVSTNEQSARTVYKSEAKNDLTKGVYSNYEAKTTTLAKEQTNRNQSTEAIGSKINPSNEVAETFSTNDSRPMNDEVVAESYRKVSAPATSASDISAHLESNYTTKRVITSVNVASQKNVLNFLVAKY